MEINLCSLAVTACHGVLPQEKITPQSFLFDVKGTLDGYAAACGDDLTKTVNYAELAACITAFATQNHFDLIETLAHRTALEIMKRFPLFREVMVTVHKPQAPMPYTFQTVSVTDTLTRERVLLSLGSSMGEKEAFLSRAIEALDKVDGVTVKAVSPFLSNAPYGGVAKNTFVNCAVEIECLLQPQDLLDEIHRIEASLGRTRDVHWGDRTIDIDIVFFGQRLICTDTLIVPHADYRNRNFVLIPLKQIAPDFVCPDCRKPIKDL